MRSCCALLVVVSAAMGVPVALADDLGPSKLRPSTDARADSEPLQAEAKRAFEQGRRAFDAGRYEEAGECFDRAYLLSGRAELLFNVGIAADRLRDDARALQAFERLRAREPDSELRGQVERRVAALRAARERAATRSADLQAAARTQPAPASAPTPEQVARAARPQPATREPAPSDAADRDEDGGILSQWWFWTAAGVVIAGGAVSAYLLTRDTDSTELPPPNTGVVIPTLRVER